MKLKTGKILIQFISLCNFCLNSRFFQDEIFLQNYVFSSQYYIFIDKIYIAYLWYLLCILSFLSLNQHLYSNLYLRMFFIKTSINVINKSLGTEGTTRYSAEYMQNFNRI